MNEYLKSGRQALRLLYFLVISYSLTNAIATLFSTGGGGAFSLPAVEKLAMFSVFLSLITRFCLGAYRVLSEDIEIELRRPKIITDIIGFFLQALLFYVYSLNYSDAIFSQWLIVLICSLDFVWLTFLAVRYKIIASTYREWMVHNILFVAFVVANIYWLHSEIALLVVAVIAFGVDIWFNADFYLARTQGLRIFVAGPYGDNGPQEEIEKNVRAAREVGKEIALRGHFPFIPHTMLHGWETDGRFTIEHFKAIDFKWLEFCDALYFLAPSAGANIEKQIATRKGLQIFTSLDQIPSIPQR